MKEYPVEVKITNIKRSNILTEICERKGIGHPDTFCDLLAEYISLNLSRYYVQQFGFILHHNVDKILLAGGKSMPAFGGGRIIEPIRLFLAGRATYEYKGKKIPVEDILHSSLADLLKTRYREIHPANFSIVNAIRPGSADLVNLFERGFESGIFLANDTSSGVGYAPLSPLEKIVLETEQILNSTEGKEKFPFSGEDIKIMGVLKDNKITLTAGIAFIDKYVSNISDYSIKKDSIRQFIENKFSTGDFDLEVGINSGDNIEKQSVFLTVTGTSAEAGDDGEVGRGNRPNGLICPYRPMTMEAIAGKNPITHVGKLYNWISMKIADEIVKIEGIEQCFCYLVSRIGSPVDNPYFVDIQIECSNVEVLKRASSQINKIVHENLKSLGSFGMNIVKTGTILVV